MSASTIEAAPVPETFSDDDAAQARFETMRRYLAWRRRLLPLLPCPLTPPPPPTLHRLFLIRSFLPYSGPTFIYKILIPFPARSFFLSPLLS